MNYLLLLVSVVTDTLRNMYNNHFSKELMKTSRDSVMFNAFCGIGAVVFFVCSGAEWKISGFSLGIAVCFALVTALAQRAIYISGNGYPYNFRSCCVFTALVCDADNRFCADAGDHILKC